MAEVEGRLVNALHERGTITYERLTMLFGGEVLNKFTNAKGCPAAWLTGFSKFDSRAGGLQPSDLIIIAGETSQGKTRISPFNGCQCRQGRGGAGVGIFSLEMRNTQLVSRMLSPESGIPSTAIVGRLDERQFQCQVSESWEAGVF